jgi:hypothetical protein
MRLKGLQWAAAMIAAGGVAFAASETATPHVFYGDVTVAPWSATVAVSSVSAATNGSYAAAQTNYYAVAAQRALGITALGPVTNIAMAGASNYVRIVWPSASGATNYLLARGSTSTNLTNYVNVAAQGVTNEYFDWGTNTWRTGTVSATVTSVPWLRLPASGHTPVDGDVVRAQDLATLCPTCIYTRIEANAEFINTNETGTVTSTMLADGTIAAADMAAGSVGNTNVGAGAISTNKLASDVDVRYLNAEGAEVLNGSFTVRSNVWYAGSLINTMGFGSTVMAPFGAGAVDLQGVRTDSNSVAGGLSSTIPGGRNQRAAGSYSAALWGQNNQAGANYAAVGGFQNIASGLYSIALGKQSEAHKDNSIAIGTLAAATNTGSVVISDASSWGGTQTTSQADNDFTVRATGGARFLVSSNGLKVIDQNSNIVVKIGGLYGMRIGTNSITFDTSGNMTATDVWMRVQNANSNDHPVALGQVNFWNAGTRPLSPYAVYYTDQNTNLQPLSFGQVGSTIIFQGSNGTPQVGFAQASATNVYVTNLVDFLAGTFTNGQVMYWDAASNKWRNIGQGALTVGYATNAGAVDGYDSSAFQLYLGAVTNNGAFLVAYTNGTFGWAIVTASATNVDDILTRITFVPTNYTPTGTNLYGHQSGVDARLGQLAQGTGNASRIRGFAIATNVPTHGQGLVYDTNTASWLPGAVSATSSGNATSLQGLAVATNAPTHGQNLEWSSNLNAWVPSTDDGGAAGAVSNLNDLADVEAASPSAGQVLGYNGSGWAPTNDAGSGGGYSGNGIMGTYTVTADVQSVSILVPSQTNKHLIIDVVGREAGTVGAYLMYINGDTGNKYDRSEFYVSGAIASLGGGTSLGQAGVYVFVDSVNAATQNWGRARIRIDDYTNSARFKHVLVQSSQIRDNGNAQRYFDYLQAKYTNTPSPVTNLNFTGYNSNIVAGTTFTLRWED